MDHANLLQYNNEIHLLACLLNFRQNIVAEGNASSKRRVKKRARLSDIVQPRSGVCTVVRAIARA
eukprot:5667594-Pleurochrysis_carterae.AAC.2